MSLYLTTSDPAAIEVIEVNAAGLRSLHERAHDWAEQRGSDVVMMGGWGSKTYVSGLPAAPTGFGQWTQPKNGTSKPYRTNAAEIEALKDLVFVAKRVPGLPEYVHSVTDANGQSYVMWPRPFVVEGQAFIAYSHRLDPNDSDKFGEQWAECLASQYYAAEETRKGVKVPA